jgi:hypothetical protein
MKNSHKLKDKQKNNEKQTIKEDETNQNEKLKKIESQNEFGGRKGPEPTRYGDWEKNGRCIDF